MRPLKPPPRVVIASDRQHPPPRLFEPAAEPTRSYRQQEVSQIPTSINDFDEDVREQMRLLEESVRATLQLPPDSIDVPRISHPQTSVRSNYGSATMAIPPTTLKSKMEEAQSNVNLNQWKQLGYPSEYAYAKDLGLLNEKPKPPIAASSNNAVNQASNKQLNQISYAQQLQQQVDEKRLQREKEAKESRILQPPLSSANITAIGSTRDIGRPNGNDLSYNFGSPAPSYQRPIEGSYNTTSMHKSTAPPSKESFASFQNDKSGFHSGRKESNSFQQSSGLALGLDANTEKELKRKKQLEYKAQLDKEAIRDQHLSPRAVAGTRQDSHVSMNIYSGANDKPQRMDSANFRYMDPGMHNGTAYQGQEQQNGVDKTSRRFKQEEYKRELDRQMHEKASIAVNNTAPKAHTDPNKVEGNRNLPQQHRPQDYGQQYPRDPVRPSPYDTAYAEQQYYAGDGYYPSQSEMDNDPHFQAYLRRKNEENQYQYHQREAADNRNGYGGQGRGQQPPSSYSQAESNKSASSPGVISPGHPSRMKHVAEVYGYGSNPLLGDGSSSNNNNNISHRNGQQQKISTTNQKALLDQQVNEVRERKKLEKLKIEEEDQKREKRIQDEIAAEEEKKRKDKQLLQEQAKRELIEMQEKANKDAMIRKGKAAAATTSAAPPVSSRAQNTLDEDRQSHQRDMNDYPPNNSNMGYHESREVYEPVNESVSYPKNSYNQQPQQPNRNVYPNPVQGDHSQIDFDNDPHFQAYLRRKAAESQYYSDNHGEYEQRHPAEQITTSQPGNFDRMRSEQPALSPSKPSPKQSSRMKLFSDVYGYGSNPLVAGTGSNGAADNDWKPSGGQSKQKISASAQKAILDEQLHAVRERKRLEQLKIEEDDKRREKRAQDELAAVEEKKRQEAEKKKQLADQERQEMLALQEKVKNEALARRGKAAAASEVRPEQPGPPGSEEGRRSDRGQFDHISSPLKNAMEGTRSQQPYHDSRNGNGEEFRRDDRRQRPPPPQQQQQQQQSRDYYYEDGNRSLNNDNIDDRYPDAPYSSANDSLSYSNTYTNYPPKPNYPHHQAPAPYRDRHNNYGTHGPPYDPRYDQAAGGYPSHTNRGRPNNHNNHMYPGPDNNDSADFDSSQISDRSFNNYQSNNNPHGYPNGYPQGGQHYPAQHPRHSQHQPPPHHNRAGPRFAPSEYADNDDDNDLSFVSESRLLPANPWSSSDMLSNLIPLGSKMESQRAANKNRSELEQSLASNSLLLYLGNRTPLVEPTRESISDGNDRARSASTPQRRSSAAHSAPKSDHTSDERLKRLIEDTKKVIDKEMNATSAAAGVQRQQKDSMKSLLGYQQDNIDRPRGNATPDGQSSVRRTGTGERPTTGMSSVIQRSGVSTIISDSSAQYQMSQQRTGSRGGSSSGGGGARTPASGKINNLNGDSNPWDVSAEVKEAMRRQLSSAKKSPSSSAIHSPLSVKLRSSEDDIEEASYLNDSFS